MKSVVKKFGKKNRLVTINKVCKEMLKTHKVILTTSDNIRNQLVVCGFENEIEAENYLDRCGYRSNDPFNEFAKSSDCIYTKAFYKA